LENQKRANIVLYACILFNLSIGVLYAWSVIATRLTAPIADGGFGWTASQAGLPYSVAIIMLATAMLFGGRIQDKIGPRWVMTAGGLLIGAGNILAGFIGNSLVGVTLGFGILAAGGMGLGYGCATAPALKWFHPGKKGLVSGLIVGGFGLSAVGFAPLASTLLANVGIEQTFIFLGLGNLIITTTLAQFIKNPPAGYVPAEPAKTKQAAVKSAPAVNFAWNEMLRTKRFFLMFTVFLLTSSVGVMVIGSMTRIAQTQAGITDAGILAGLVAFLAFMNAVGRVAGGILSDKIGRINALFVILVLQLVNMAAFAFYQNLPTLILGIVVVGFCFGTLLSVMPALCADQYGLKNFGFNYAILFLAWGFSGVIAPVFAGFLYDTTGSFNTAYLICAVMMVGMILANYLLKKDMAKASA